MKDVRVNSLTFDIVNSNFESCILLQFRFRLSV